MASAIWGIVLVVFVAAAFVRMRRRSSSTLNVGAMSPVYECA